MSELDRGLADGRFERRVLGWFFSFLDSNRSEDAPSESSSTSLGGVDINDYDPTDPIVLIVSHAAWMWRLLRSIQAYPFSLRSPDVMERQCHNTSVLVMRCWRSRPGDVERRKAAKEVALRRSAEERGPATPLELEKGGTKRNGSDGLNEPKPLVEMGWDGEILSWGDASHLDGLLQSDVRDGTRGGPGRVADDIRN